MQRDYRSSFERFLAHSDEKNVLFREILKDIRMVGATSLIDIGAGNGSLAIPLAREVERYQAIEPNEAFAEALRAAGVEVLQETFPCAVNGPFDFALLSHSVPYDEQSYEIFLEAAFDLLAPKGELLVITYPGLDDNFTQLLKRLGKRSAERHRHGYAGIVLKLFHLAEDQLESVKIRQVVTKVETTTANEMVDALSFVAGDGDLERMERFLRKRRQIRRILYDEYRISDTKFSFSFKHKFLRVRKP